MSNKLDINDIQDIFNNERFMSLNLESILDRFVAGETCQEIIGIPDSLMDLFTEIADEYLMDKHYQEASDCFFFLATLNPFESEYWLRLGNSEQGSGHNEDSLQAYSMAMLTNADDPFPHYYSSEVYYLIGDHQKALHCLDVASCLLDESFELEEARSLFSNLREKIEKSGRTE